MIKTFLFTKESNWIAALKNNDLVSRIYGRVG